MRFDFGQNWPKLELLGCGVVRVEGLFKQNVTEQEGTKQKTGTYTKKRSNVGKCRFFGGFGILYALASCKVENIFGVRCLSLRSTSLESKG